MGDAVVDMSPCIGYDSGATVGYDTASGTCVGYNSGAMVVVWVVNTVWMLGTRSGSSRPSGSSGGEVVKTENAGPEVTAVAGTGGR